VWLSDLSMTPLDSTPYNVVPHITASSHEGDFVPAHAMDNDLETRWRSGRRSGKDFTGPIDSVDIDFLKSREFAALLIEWESGRRAMSYSLRTSQDGHTWTTIAQLDFPTNPPAGMSRSRDYVQFYNGAEGRFLRLILSGPEGSEGFGIREINVIPIDWTGSGIE
jgi:hypothetical protein